MWDFLVPQISTRGVGLLAIFVQYVGLLVPRESHAHVGLLENFGTYVGHLINSDRYSG